MMLWLHAGSLSLLTGQDEAEGRRLQKKQELFTESHGNADGSHHHQEEAEQGQHRRRHVQIWSEGEDGVIKK